MEILAIIGALVACIAIRNWWVWRPVREAQVAYESARIRTLMVENNRRLAELRAARECPYCLAQEVASDPHPCETQASR